MILHRKITEAFQKNAMEYFERDFEKHKNYLLRVAFGRNSASIPKKDFEEALAAYSSDPTACVNQLLDVLLPVIEKTMKTIHERGMNLIEKYNSGQLSASNRGNGGIEVQSESNSAKTYTVNLNDMECTCPYYEKVRFAGMLCKHIFFANEVFGNISKSETVSEKSKPSPEKMEVAVCDRFFCYGSQKLTRREKRGNPHIPSSITYMLEDKGPEIAIYALENSETLLLIGESGVGKSKFIYYLAQETNTPLLNACGHSEITVENLLGTMTVVNGNTVWKDGILPDAMRRGYWLLLDEINSIDPGVVKVINELLDNRKITITVAGEPRLVKAHRDFRFICTMNPSDSPIYKGIETMSFELIDRFDTVVYLDYLSSDTEAKLIMDITGFSDEVTARKIVQFANTIRNAMKKGEIFATVTTRSLISFCRKAQSFDLRTSADAAILRKMSAADREKAYDVFNAMFK